MICQGSNSPLHVRISGSIDNVTNISVLLHDGTAEVKSWEMEDLTITETKIFAPLSESDTLAFPAGTLILEVKWSDGDGVVHIEPTQKVRVDARLDKAVISTVAEADDDAGDDPAEDPTEDPIEPGQDDAG